MVQPLLSDIVVNKTSTNSPGASMLLSKAPYIHVGILNSKQMILTWEHFGTFLLRNAHSLLETYASSHV